MREIKFRAWDRVNKEIRPVTRLNLYNWEVQLSNWETRRCDESCDIMQYTRLKDKNWKKIYEGDILEWTFRKNIDWKKDVSLWKIEYYYWSFFVTFGFQQMSKIPVYNISAKTVMIENYVDRYEVIWNIYENPDLLKKLSND